MDIGQQLRTAAEAAIKAGETRYAIAKGAGVDYAALKAWLDDGTDIRMSTAAKLAAHLNLELCPAEQPKPKGKR